MSIKAVVAMGLLASGGVLFYFGRKKYMELQGLKLLQLLPDSPALSLGNATDSMVDGTINLLIDNPTDYDYHIKDFSADIHGGNSSVRLGALRMADVQIFSKKKNPMKIYTTIDFGSLSNLVKDIFSAPTATVFMTGTVTYVSSGISVPYPFSFQVDLKDQLKQILKF